MYNPNGTDFIPKGKPPAPTPGEIAEAKEEAARGWRVVIVDNLDRENVSDSLLCECPSEAIADSITRTMNAAEPEPSERFFRAYEPGKPLFEWTP